MTEATFRNSQARDDLKKLLESEPLKTALEIIQSIPAAIPIGPNGMHLTDAVLARILAESVGVNKAITHLKRLSEPVSPTEAPELDNDPNRPEGFDYLPEPLKAAIREQYKKAQQP